MCPVFEEEQLDYEQMRKTSQRLKEDNVKLFRQCIKLRKQCDNFQAEKKIMEDIVKENNQKEEQLQRAEMEVNILKE